MQSFATRKGKAASFIPILGTHLGTWDAAQRLAAVTPAILPTSAKKIQEAKVPHSHDLICCAASCMLCSDWELEA